MDEVFGQNDIAGLGGVGEKRGDFLWCESGDAAADSRHKELVFWVLEGKLAEIIISVLLSGQG